MIQDEISSLAERIAQDPQEIDGHSVVILADYEGCGCVVGGDALNIGKVIIRTMLENKTFAKIIVACGEAYLHEVIKDSNVLEPVKENNLKHN